MLPGPAYPGRSDAAAAAAERRVRGVDVDLPWAPAVVLFGRNDAGKSNILSQISELFDPPEDKWWPPRPGGGSVVLAFDDFAVDDSSDAHFLAELIQFKDARFYFHRDGFGGGGSVERVLLVPDGLGADIRVALGTDVQQLSVIRERIKAQLLSHAAGSCDEWVSVVRHFEAALDACLQFRTVVVGLPRDEEAWFAVPFPSHDELPPYSLEALHELELRREVWRDERIPFIEPLLARDAWDDVEHLLFEIGTIGGGFSPYKVVRLGADAQDMETFGERVTSELIGAFDVTIREFTSEFPGLRQYISPNDWWFHRQEEFERIEDAWVRVSPVVVAICEEVSRRATDLAPSFIRSAYDIHVLPLPPDQVGDETRVAVLLVAHASTDGGAQAFDISAVASGIALWTAYSVVETIRRLFEELLDVVRRGGDTLAPLADLVPGLSFLVDERAKPASEPVVPAEDLEQEARARDVLAEMLRTARTDLVFAQRTLYVIDEPERHLHPLAQADVAGWVAGLAQDAGADVVVASHANPFLNLPSTLAEYVLVIRDETRVTRAIPVTADAIGLLDEVAEDTGLSRADLIQLVRAFLIVEGANDKRVVEHFFGKEFRRERVLVVPLHGSSKLRLLAEAEVIRQMGRLILVLLDNTADVATAESRQIVKLLAHWPTDGSVPPPIPIRFAAPDIIRVFDDGMMSVAFRRLFSREWQGWAAIDDEFARTPANGWKYLLRRRLPQGASEDELVRVLLQTVPADGPPPALARAVEEAIALVSEAVTPNEARAERPT